MKIITSLKPPFFGSSKKSKTRTRSQPVTRTDRQALSFGSSSGSSSSDSSTADKITRRELERVLRRLGPDPPSDEEVMTMLAEADRDGNGCISYDEIVALGSGPGRTGSELRETFRVFDADGDGKISAEELMGLFVMLGDEECGIEECRRMIRVVDSDGDGFVCYQDFVRMMDMQMQQQR